MHHVRAMAVWTTRRAFPAISIIRAIVGQVVLIVVVVQRHHDVLDDMRHSRHLDGGEGHQQAHDHHEELHVACCSL